MHPPPQPAPASSLHPDKGPHYELIKQKIPPWLLATSPARAEALSKARLDLASWYHSAPPQAHASLKTANAQAWVTQNTVDERLEQVQDVYAFAEPLLTQALKTTYGVDASVRDTFLFLYSVKGTFIQGVTSRSVSLLDAALHNFAKDEHFTDDSSYTSRPDARGHFTLKPLKQQMSIAQFTALCRQLDLGAQYQRHLQQHLLPTDETQLAALHDALIASQKAALNAAAHHALLTHAIDAASFHVLQRALNGERGVLQFYELQMMDSRLTSILLIAADLERATVTVPVLAYIPHDPQAPLMAYPSSAAFMQALTDKLRTAAYRQFFSQFIDQQQRGHFFANLEQRLNRVQWYRRTDPLDTRPTWRDTPVDQPRLQYAAVPIDGDLWRHRLQRGLDKIFNDARDIVVSTADSDSRARWAWWDNFSRVLSEIFNAALLVITPFVPWLGELMLAYTAYQLLDEVVEGVVDLAEGQAREAATHLVGVVNEVVQLGAFHIGGQLVKLIPSPFVDQLQAIEHNGQPRLWNPDLRPYALKAPGLPGDSAPDALGLHTHAGRSVLPLDGEHYEVRLDDAGHRIQHPSRPDAYAPRLQHNGQGAWTHEAEDPRTWDDPQLMRRLGHSVNDLDAAQLEQLRQTSGTEYNELRALHRDNAAPSPRLADSLKRWRLRQHTERLAQRLKVGEAVDDDTYWSPHLATELPQWPADQAIDVYEEDDLGGAPLRYGATDANAVLPISRQALNRGELAPRLLDVLNEAQLQALAGPLPQTRAARIDALRQRLADQLAVRQRAVFDYLYQHSESVNQATALRVREAFPELPKSQVEYLLEQARPDERALMTHGHHLPLRLKSLGRALQLQARATHAYEGFHAAPLLNEHSERMMLGALEQHSPALAALHLQVRSQSTGGAVRAEAGRGDARRILVHREDGQYAVYDGAHQSLHPASDFYSALLNALPRPTRTAMGDAAADGPALRNWLMERLVPLEDRCRVLADPIGAPPERETLRLVQAPRFKWASKLLGLSPGSVEERVKALYPGLSAAKVQEQVQAFDSPDGLTALRELEREKKQLAKDLKKWVEAPTSRHQGNIEEQTAERLVRSQLSQALRRSWEKSASGYRDGFGERQPGSRLDLEGWPLGTYLLHMPTLRTPLKHITSLNLGDTGLGDAQARFLELFPNLITLELAQNRLTRLPETLTTLPRLTQLGLSANPLQWDAHSLAQLNTLSRLKVLDLSYNRLLREPPDISGMPDLRELYLTNTQLTQWPQGLFEQPRPEDFLLDLQNSPIKSVPKFLPWQAEALLVARTRLDRNQLGLDDEERMVSYRLGAGLDPYRTYPPRGEQDSAFWLQDLPAEQGPSRQRQWDELEQEHGSQGFFEVIRSLQTPNYFETEGDRAAYLANRRALSLNVWRMLDAMHADEALRRRFFTLASAPANCADAGAQVFNSLGVQTLVYEAYAARPALEEGAFARRLAHLAWQAARLSRVTALARQEVAHRLAPIDQGGLGLRLTSEVIDGVPGSVDEVQVHTALQTALKARLHLPWLAEHMVYRVTASVNPALIEKTYKAVIESEAGDGRVDALLNVEFWDRYLEATHAEALALNTQVHQDKAARLDDLLQAQHAWVQGQGSRQSVETLADALGVPRASVLTDAPVSQATYERWLEDVGQAHKALRRQLTRDALGPLQSEAAPSDFGVPDHRSRS
ncbi:NEL-type E3 ubiquitin ligase domain-containing protein [Pseudomonas sp. NFPP24]|uniref:NEL-type E3 ubiquitin ligase domain-containing protein n=1 Tax=Pseudomonas sp. NFPP24 TaxID=1566228 RepID=UPI0008E08226|nr:DUF6543 domain-containing protein [Pseudomonas sp. NFPP24]SFA87354.1 Leucine rich repeat-containing protein [Pseudomonas sp. NFPP24]